MATTKRQRFKGNLGNGLYGTMGIQQANGVTRHGQSCYLFVYPQNAETRKRIAELHDVYSQELDNRTGEPSGPIDAVIEAVFDNYLHYQPEPGDDHWDQDDGQRAGAGWIYGALMVAKQKGCTYASVMITSNDGNLSLEAANPETGVLVSAVHHTYYGT